MRFAVLRDRYLAGVVGVAGAFALLSESVLEEDVLEADLASPESGGAEAAAGPLVSPSVFGLSPPAGGLPFLLSRKSVTYQPLPFRMNEVWLISLVSGPLPHASQLGGGGSAIFWRCSEMFPQASQRYS